MWNALVGPVQTAFDVAMKHMVQKCPFLLKNPTLATASPEALRHLAARCPVMGPVVSSRLADTKDAVDDFLAGMDPAAPHSLKASPTVQCAYGLGACLAAPARHAVEAVRAPAKSHVRDIPARNDQPADNSDGLFNFNKFFENMVDKKKQDNSYRIFNSVNRIATQYPKADRRVHVDDEAGLDKHVTVWCSNDYLGMSRHPNVVNAVIQSVKQHGVGSGGTRNISGTSMHHALLEADLAKLHQKEAALVFSSCFVANDATLSTIGSHIPGLVYFSDAMNHSSMIEGIRHSNCEKRIFKHNNVKHLEELLNQYDKSVPKIVAFESVYSMSGSISPLNDLCDLAHEHNALTFVDEVHAVGMYGDTGAGVGEMLGVQDKFDIISGTLSKAFGVLGGYIAGSAAMVDTVRSYAPGFIFTTSLPPMICAAARESIKVVKDGNDLRAKQQANAKALKVELVRAGIPFLENPSHIVPVMVGNAKKCKQLSDELLRDHHIYVQSINYPTVPVGTERLRITPGPLHTPEMMHVLVDALVQLWHKHHLLFDPPKH